MKDFPNIEVEEIEVRATGGAPIDHCLRDAIAFAMQQDAKVTLVHNEREFRIDPASIINPIYKQHPQ